MTSQTPLTASRIATLRKQVGTLLWRFGCYPMIICMHAAMLAVALPVLAVWLALDFLPKRRGSSRSTSPSPHLRRLAIPLREGGKIWALNPDGSRVELSHLEAVTQARAWNDVCFGALVSQRPSDKGTE